MNDRKTISVLIAVLVLLEGFLLVRSGLISWLMFGPHTAETFRDLIVSWQIALSVAIVTVILWLAYAWIRVGPQKTKLTNRRHRGQK